MQAMTAINGLGPAAPAGRTMKSAAGAGAFRLDETSVSSGAAPTTAPTTATTEISLAGLLALQADDAGEARDRSARRRGRELLDALAALQRAMLGGEIDQDQLHDLAALVADVPDAADSRLRAAMEDVVLRVRVELARHGVG
jgi:Class II flagellar assembly regulator